MNAPQINQRMDAVADKIANQTARIDEAKATLDDADQELANIATEESELIAAVGALGAGTYNDHKKDELAEMTSAFAAQRNRAQAGSAAL